MALPAADGKGNKKVSERLKNQTVWFLLYLTTAVFWDPGGFVSVCRAQGLSDTWA